MLIALAERKTWLTNFESMLYMAGICKQGDKIMDYDIVTDNPSLAQCVAECNSDAGPHDANRENYVQDTLDMQILLEAFRL